MKQPYLKSLFVISLFCLAVAVKAQPANDLWSGAIAVTIGSQTAGTTTNATDDTAESTLCGTSITAPGVWYTFTGNGADIDLNTCTNTAYDSKISVFTGVGGSLVCVDGNDDACGVQSKVVFTSVNTVAYSILVHGFSGTGDFELSVTEVIIPPNDFCADAIPMGIGTQMAGNTLGATTDVGTPNCGTALITSPGVWYTFTGNGQDIRVSTCDAADFNTKIGVYTGTCGSLVCETGNDDGAGCTGSTSELTFTSTLDVEYHILVHAFGGATGTFTLSITEVVIPANDLCVNAVPMGGINTQISGTTVDATIDTDESTSCGASVSSPGVWYSFTGNGQDITVSTCDNADFDTKISVFTGACGALVCETGNDDGTGCTGSTSELTFTSTLDTEYHILVHGFGGETGTFTLSVSGLDFPGTPDEPTTGTITVNSIVVNWTAPASDGGSAITAYVLEENAGSGFVEIFNGNALTFTSTGLTKGAQYTYRVKAVNAIGDSQYSAILTTSPIDVPGVPINLVSSNLTGNSVTFSWTAPNDDGGSPITAYVLEQKLALGGTYSEIFNGTGLTFTATGLIPITQYAYQVKAVNAAGSGPYTFAPVTTISLDQTITFDPIPDKTFGDPDFELVATSDSGLPITFQVIGGSGGRATVSGSTVTITMAGTIQITANQIGGSGYNAATSVSQTFTVNKRDQIITFDAIPDKIINGPDFELVASSDSGLPVSFGVDSGSAFLTGTGTTVTIALQPPSTVQITAFQIGDENYNAATSVTQTFEVSKQAQAITFGPIDELNFTSGLTLTLTASASSTLGVSYTITGPDASVEGNVVTFNAPGKYTVSADQSGNGTYAPAPTVALTFCVNPEKPTILFNGSGSSVSLTSSSAAGNIWYMDGTATGETNPTTSINQVGIYTVQVDIDGCMSPVSDEVNIIITGVDKKLSSAVTVYPNPASNKITIQFQPNWIGRRMDIKIINTTGQVILYEQSKLKTTSKELDIGRLAPGAYFLRVLSGNDIINYKIQKK